MLVRRNRDDASRSLRGRTIDVRLASPHSSSTERGSSTATPRRCGHSMRRAAIAMSSRTRDGSRVLGREALSIRFYRALERAVNGSPSSSTSRQRPTFEPRSRCSMRPVCSSCLSCKQKVGSMATARFSFASSSGASADAGGFHDRVLRPLFFGTLNTPLRRELRARAGFGRIPFLNGGLFARTPRRAAASRRFVPRRRVRPADLRRLRPVPVHGARRVGSTWSEAAVDPEMLGKAFESLMAAAERGKTGAFFTPFSAGRPRDDAPDSKRYSVRTSCRAGWRCVQPTRARRGRVALGHAHDSRSGLRSGAFLVHALERLATVRAQLGDDAA